jgi:malate/lactate dehydrogenase
MNINIAGIGRLGGQIAFCAMVHLRPEIMSLHDIKDLKGDILDLEHAKLGLNINTHITTNLIKADITIISAGFPRDPQNKPWSTILNWNQRIVKDVINSLRLPKGSPIILLTNPIHDIFPWALETWGEYHWHNIESILKKYREGKESGWPIVTGGKGYTSFGPAIATIEKIAEILDCHYYERIYLKESLGDK